MINKEYNHFQHFLLKAPTGIQGLDEITGGGFPAKRATLICGESGTGKTVMAMEYLVRGAKEYNEPGLMISFEESEDKLIHNFLSFGFDIATLLEQKKLKIVHLEIKRSEIIETGEFSLDGLMIHIQRGIESIGAKRLAMDTLESLFSALVNVDILRKEFDRLFKWLSEKGITTVITGEKGSQTLTRHGFEEYVSDCVLLLDHRISEQISKRRLRIIKYRGSHHGKDEYPFVIGLKGISVFPITSLQLHHEASIERVSTGIDDLDLMLGGKGYFRGSSVLVSGKAGTGKSSLAAAFATAACKRGERCLYFAFEESPAQLIRNMGSIGLHLDEWIQKNMMVIDASRPTFCGLEEHLVNMKAAIDEIDPHCVIIDPITNFVSVGKQDEVKAMLLRVMDYLKAKGLTLFVTALTAGSGYADETELHVSSLIDTWIVIDQIAKRYTRRLELFIVKSRGMDHSRTAHELILSSNGLSLQSLE